MGFNSFSNGIADSASSFQPKLSDCGSQNSPFNPTRAKIVRMSCGCGLRESSRNLVEYHVVASIQS